MGSTSLVGRRSHSSARPLGVHAEWAMRSGADLSRVTSVTSLRCAGDDAGNRASGRCHRFPNWRFKQLAANAEHPRTPPRLMPTQAIPLALLSSLYPFGLVALLLLFGATRARPRSAVFLIGAATCLLIVGFVFVFVLRGVGLDQSSSETPRYGLRL